ncbi:MULTISPECIES: iron ABC transporter permease [unclassified Rhizobium]|uniref:FecCD family ABC transporter permease n=2 Tax=unclassified Rhizobium TaxID=2613769 RepID=UPI001ADAB8AE|nr:iron ABC transporter permease [Rhizobium sp. L58/93]MBO9168391.1 iron ABC transporter permease [Rhizobium sp. L245/93]QXZ88192.1 iron ABC transporter permease [Rhizobium sp. K1/93]QXZ94366.1 iron ABC transporter permease [Rhizobium sp. K15/93]QYA05740.1 iron ABC transporter permease [Rhizobium sp. B21/90]
MTTSATQPRKGGAWMWLGLCGVLALSITSMMVGKYGAGPVVLFGTAKAALTGGDVDPILSTVLWNVRLPRVLAGLCVGAALSAAGATYQGLFRNPLVSPDILGVSAGASLGAVLGIFLSLPVIAIQLLGFAGGLLAVTAVYAVGATIRGRDPVLTLVLAGVAIGALVGAGISLIKILADPYDQLPAITYWLLGSLTAVTRFDVLSILPALIIGVIPLVLLRWRMNVMTLGDDEAQTMGIDTFRTRALLIAAATLITAASVSVTGIIGWVGLIVPHIARMLVGPDFRKLLPASMMLGGAYLLVVDMLARSIALIEVPLGILTAAVGAPFFLWLLAAGKRGWQ